MEREVLVQPPASSTICLAMMNGVSYTEGGP
jgi:hypothetical protein